MTVSESEGRGGQEDTRPAIVARSRRWWEQFPERLTDELRELDLLGVEWEINEAAQAVDVLCLDLNVPINDEVLPFVATFPDTYPYFPFTIQAPTMNLAHHQHPFGKNLCLLPRSTEWWQPETDRLAHFLRDRVPTAISAGSSNDSNSAASEEHVPEPFSDYYQYQPNTMVLIAAGDTGDDRIPAASLSGTFTLGLEGTKRGGFSAELRGALLEVRDECGSVVLRAPGQLADCYPVTIEGRWARRAAPVVAASVRATAETVYSASAGADPNHGHPTAYATAEGRRIQVRAVLFPEEHRWRGNSDAFGDGWTFAVRLQRPLALQSGSGRHRNNRIRGAPAGDGRGHDYYLARPARYSPGDLAARAPELAPLRNHTIALFGLGCIGSPSAIEFARSMIGGLNLLDHDVVDPATTVRWQFGVPTGGRSKAATLCQVIAAHYPYVRVHAEEHQVGMARIAAPNGVLEQRSEQEVLDAMLDASSLLYDATAERGIQHFLADTARERGIPYVSVEGTPGGWGGVVLRIVPGVTEGCWLCFQHWRNEAIDADGIAPPPSDEAGGNVHPQGCADATYTGANVDLSEVALQGVRTAIGTLAAGSTGGYPAPRWDVAVLALRDSVGALIPPTWTTYQLQRHQLCVECARLDESRA